MRVLPGLFRATVFYLILNPSQVVAEEPPPPAPVSQVPTTSDVFSLATINDKGNCISVLDRIDGFLSESVELLNAGMTAIARHRTDKVYRELFSAWLGIQWDGTDLEDESKSLWNTINDRFASVAQFLRQGGLKNSRTRVKPWLFCSDQFAVKKNWADIAKDVNGESAVKTYDEDGDPDEYYTIQDLYGDLKYKKREPFWVEKLRGYDFDNDGQNRLCGRPSRYAATLPASQGIHRNDNTGDFDPHTFLCPRAFQPGGKFFAHSKPALGAILESSVYPSATNEDHGLDYYGTLGCTLYHELFHLTDYRGTSGDFFEGIKDLSSASLSDDIGAKLNVVNNAESYVMFSLACYMYQNPPAGMKAAAFLTGGIAQLNLSPLKRFNKPMMLNFGLSSYVNSSDARFALRACTADWDANAAVTNVTRTSAEANQKIFTSPLELGHAGAAVGPSMNVRHAVYALQQLQAYLGQDVSTGNGVINFAYAKKAVVGLYVGPGLEAQGIASSVIDELIEELGSNDVSETLVVQNCEANSVRYSMGIAVNFNSDLGFIQQAVQTWRNNRCVDNLKVNDSWKTLTFFAPSVVHNDSSTASHPARSQVGRANTCTSKQVVLGDSCPGLATECGITASDFTRYNPKLPCNNLPEGQHVCCTAGDLPDYSLKPDSDGNCAKHMIALGDVCSVLAAQYGVTVEDIENWNNNTWAWNGCGNMQPDNWMCLSSGWPPMPTNVKNAVCGPQMNDTATAPHGTDLNKLNPCPLNACCDIWGQCGTTTDFCTPTDSPTGAPGTAAKDTNGCISDCGTQILVSSPPPEFFSIAYFLASDWSRPCLTMSVTDIDKGRYTHIHFSFLTINPDFSLNTTLIESQLPFLVGMSGIKRIVSVGGWDFSASPETYNIFRTAMAAENRGTLVDNIIDFLNDNDLDGVDWDWEYPGEPDIPNIPPSPESDSTNYFLFLNSLRSSMATKAPGKTISVTAPASFWYLKGFPIQAISLVSDYIVLMTYDLHGQWDYDNSFADTGCPAGNCLRSHVNITETMNALSMVTKAGVPSKQLIVGVSSYGRSFGMTTPWVPQQKR